jgi:hypothetical protein
MGLNDHVILLVEGFGMPSSGFSRLLQGRIAAVFCALCLLLLSLALAPGALAAPQPGKWVRFAKGKLEVQLPQNLSPREEKDGTLTATFGPGGANRLELMLLDPQKEATPTDTAEQFVEYYARQRKLPVHTNGDKAVVMEGAEGKLDGKPVRIARWQIGFGRSLVVMTLTAPAEKTMPPDLKQFLEQDLEALIKSVRRLN